MDNREETREDYIVSPVMKAVRTIQLQMVQKLLEVCKHYDLKIWADGGTLLGLVREHGYIPWDDDIDMLMPRKDYDHLISVASSEFKSPFFFQCANTDTNYFKGHSQLRYDVTTEILASDVFLPIHQGIFIDVFVYDSIPDSNDDEWKRRLHRADIISNRLNNYTYGYKLCINPIANFTQLYNIVYCKIIPTKRQYEEYENLFRFYDDKQCKQVACPCFNRKIIKTSTKQKEWYRETIHLPFEDIQLPAPIDYDKVLRTQYGDTYMIPQRSPSLHGRFLVLDPNMSYTEYLPKLRQKHKKGFWSMIVKLVKNMFNA